MALFRVKPTEADITIADGIAAHTGRPAEHIAQALTWGADEHVLCALAIGWWLYARTRAVSVRRASDHVLVTTIVASILPHALKKVFDQERPDRLTVLGHLHGNQCPENVSMHFRQGTPCMSGRWHRRRPRCRQPSGTPFGPLAVVSS
jgi:hypothetical protein